MNAPFTEIFALPLEERARLAEDLWDSVEEEIEKTPIPEWQLEELRRRRANTPAEARFGKTLEEFRKELRERYGRSDHSS